MRKVATFHFSDVESVDFDGGGLVKLASTGSFASTDSAKKTIMAEVEKHPTALFFRAKAIEADVPNNNGDSFSKEELQASCDTFIGVPFFTNHDNQDVERAKGKVVWSEWDEKDNSIYIVAFVDREAYPGLVRGIEEQYMTGVSMGAVGEDSMILMADLSEKPICDIKAGDEVITPFGNVCPVKTVHNEILFKPMYKFGIKTYHRTPSLTNDHPVMVIDADNLEQCKRKHYLAASKNKHARKNGMTDEFISQDGWRCDEHETVWKHAEDISVNDHFLVPSRHSVSIGGPADDIELNYLFGAYLGDGFVKFDKKGTPEGVCFSLGLHETDIVDRIKKCISSVSTCPPRECIVEERNGLYLSVYDRDLAQTLLDRFGNGSKKKRISPVEMTDSQASAILCGYLDTDGCIVNTKTGNGFGGFQISSANRPILEDVQSILISLGHVSRISTMARTASESSVVNIDTVEHTLSVGSNAKDIFSHSVKSNRKNLPDAEMAAGRTFIAHVDGVNYLACPVIDIDIVDCDRPVWDLTVDGDESYIADGIAVHNCSVEHSVCSICDNKAATMDEYCSHIRNFKGRKFTGSSKSVVTGKTKNFKDAPVYEDNYGIRFIELSGVADPACSSCRIDTIYNDGEFCGKAASSEEAEVLIRAAATCYNNASMLKVAMEKEASQSDVDSLNQCLGTLEQVSVKLIQNRANVEMEFASELVEILANLQDFVDQLVQAGFGQLPESTGAEVPGALPDDGMGMEGAQPVAAEEDLELGSSNVEDPLLEAPVAPDLGGFNEATMPSPSRNTSKLTRPTRPEKTKKAEDESDMKRRLPKKSAGERERAKQVLSKDWQGKIDEFSNNLSETLKLDPVVTGNSNGGHKMTQDKKVEAKSTSEDLHIITEKQLEKGNAGANAREGDDRDEVTQAQLEKLRKGEPEVITEAQLEGDKSGANPREDDCRKVITEKQLDEGKLAQPREGKDRDEVTQAQLESERVGEQDVITEVQLSNPKTDTPWGRSCNTSVRKHIEAASAVLAKASLATGSTPEQILRAACSFAGNTSSEKLAFATEMWNAEANAEDVSELIRKANYWSAKNVKVASASMTTREAIVAFASEAIKEEGLSPELVVESFDGIRDNDALYAIEEQVDEIISASSEAPAEAPESVKAQIGEYFAEKKASVAEESEAIAATLEDEGVKVGDHMIEASVSEVDCDGLEGSELNEKAAAFARGACAAHNLKYAALINVTVEDDVVTIAVETDNESVEIPLGGEKEDVMEEEIDLGGDVPAEDELDLGAPIEDVPEAPELGGTEGVAPPAPAGEDLLGLAASKDALTKKAQFGGGNAEVPGGQGAGAASPEDLATAPDMMPEEGGVQTFSDDEELAAEEELPGGEQQEAGTICPICGSDDTETGRKDQQPGQFDCNVCGAKYTLHLNVDVLNPEELWEGSTKEDQLEEPQMPEMPVAAFVDVSNGTLSKFADTFREDDVTCPACGRHAEIDGKPTSHKATCASCGTVTTRDAVMDIENPKTACFRIEWVPKPLKCKNCNESRKAFASDLTFKKMIKSASTVKFPVKNAIAWIDREYGAGRTVTYGPEAGKKLASTVVGQLKTFGLEHVRYMKRLCEVQTKEDPMDKCLKMQKKQGFTVREATRLCGCIKDKYASENDDNIFMAAFAGMIDQVILRKMADHVAPSPAADDQKVNEDDMLISDISVESKSNTEDAVNKTKTAGDKSLKQTVVEKEDNIPKGDGHMGKEKETIPADKSPDVPRADATMGNEEACKCEEVKIPVNMQYLGEEEPIGDKKISTKTLGIVQASEDEEAAPETKSKSHMSDGGPGEAGKSIGCVEDIESSDNVPRGDAKMGNEDPAADKAPDVPRSDAKMGNEESRDFDEPTTPQGPDAEKVEMRGRVAAETDQNSKIALARREKAVRLASRMVGSGAIADSEFEEMVSDLVNLPLDRMETYANRISTSITKSASTITTPVIMEDRGLQVDVPETMEQTLSGMFTIGDRQADKYYKSGDIDE